MYRARGRLRRLFGAAPRVPLAHFARVTDRRGAVVARGILVVGVGRGGGVGAATLHGAGHARLRLPAGAESAVGRRQVRPAKYR